VEYLLGVLALAACSLIVLLFYSDLSPKSFVYKVMKRFVDPPESLRPVVRDAPYRRATTAKSRHKPILLNLETSDGSGQACHPDIVYIPGGFGAKKWPYWMACTPYPYGDAYFENPEIFVSWDGVTWAVPDGSQNPVVPSPQIAGDHHSDPDLLFCGDELWLFYRLTLRSKTAGKRPNENKIYLMKSTDGVRWCKPVEVLSEKTGAELLSPAVIHTGTHFVMWTIEVHGGHLKLMQRSSPNGLSWSPATVASIAGLDSGRFPWHIDVLQEEDRLSAVLVSCTGLGGNGARIHYAHSEDGGRAWVAGGFLFDREYEFESKVQYRASLRAMGGAGQEYELWYSAASRSDMFSIAYLRVTRSDDRLIPSERAS
jgi:hypothetical protein